MTVHELPPLPDYGYKFEPRWGVDHGGFTKQQMALYARQYGQLCADQARAEERERCATIASKAMPQPVANLCDAQVVKSLRCVLDAIRKGEA